MTNIIEKIRNKLTARRTDASSQYWATLQKIADGKLSERAADTAIEALTPIIEQLGRADSVESDLALLEQLRDATSRLADRDTAVAEQRAAGQAARAAEQRATVLREEARQVVASAEQLTHVARARLDAIQRAEADVAAIRAQLAAAGHVTIAPAVAEEQAQQQREILARKLTLDLAAVERDLASAERNQSDRTAVPSLGPSDRVGATINHLRDRRAKLSEELASLGVSAEEAAR